jgi:Protein of unknown function (DUF3461)
METPTLTEMGINNPSEITRYTLSKPSEQTDELTIYYKRQKGSLLPIRRAYEFGRAMRTAVADSGTGRTAAVGDISPRLLEAVAELDRLLGRKESYEDRKGAVVTKLSELRKALAARGKDADFDKRLDEIEADLRNL